MTRLLVSVRNGEEAAVALAGGASWIDVKEPLQGPLGAPSREQLRDVRQAVSDRATLSAALGELTCQTYLPLLAHFEGFSYVKVGLSGCAATRGWQRLWRDWAARLPGGVQPVAVAYADFAAAEAPDLEEVLEVARCHGGKWILLDTFDKRSGNLWDHLREAQLAEFLGQARASGISTALAGSLAGESLSRAAALGPDVVAVRGAACRGGRAGCVDADLVEQLVHQLSTPRGATENISPPHILDSTFKQS